MVPRPPVLRRQLVAAVLALLAIVGMHVLDTNAHVCHAASALEAGGGEHHDSHGHHEGSGHASCAVIGCVAIVLAAVGFVAAHRRRPQSVWPPLVAAVASMVRGPEPPVPRALLSV
jgi:hypothetical protein